MDREKLVELLKGIGMDDENIVKVSDEEFEVMCKALPEDITGDALKAVLHDKGVNKAVEDDDVEKFGAALVKAVAKGAKDEDDDEDDKGKDDEDDDEGEVSAEKIKRAERELFGNDGDDDEDDGEDGDDDKDEDGKGKSKKGLTDYFEDGDEIADVIEADEMLKSIMGAVAKRQDDKFEALDAKLCKGIAGVAAKVDSALASLKGMEKLPAGRRISPFTVGGSPLDDPVGEGEGVSQGEVNAVVLKAQQAGDISGDDAVAIMGAARVGGNAWEVHSKKYAQIKKAVDAQTD